VDAVSESFRASLRRRLIGGGAWAVFGRGGTLALNFVTIALVTRVLDPDDAGAYLLAQSVAFAAAIVARLGLEHTVVWLVSSSLGSGSPGGARRAIQRVLVLGATSAVVVGLALSLGGGAFVAHAVFGSERLARVGPLVGLWSAAFALQVLLSEAMRGYHSIRGAVVYGGVISGALAVAALAVIHASTPTVQLEAVVWVTALATIVSATAGGVHLAIRTRRFGPPVDEERNSYGTVLRRTLPVLVSNIMAFVLTHVDLWVVASHLPGREVATYAAASRMVTLLTMSFLIANQVLPPVIGELAARGDKALLERTLRGTAFAVGLPTAVVLLAFVLAGRVVMRVAFGAFYEQGAVVLGILSIGQIANVFTGSSAFTLLMTGHGVAVMWLAGLGGVLAAGASLAAVGPSGATGVAWAVSAVLVFQQIVTLLVVKRLVGVWTHPSLSAALAELRRLRRKS
jgi:O-antigen/teichoic acid export membrane protein